MKPVSNFAVLKRTHEILLIIDIILAGEPESILLEVITLLIANNLGDKDLPDAKVESFLNSLRETIYKLRTKESPN